MVGREPLELRLAPVNVRVDVERDRAEIVFGELVVETCPMTPALANHVLQRVGEAGQPPEIGIEYLNVGNETVLEVLRSQYLEPMAKLARGSSFKVVQGYYGGGKTHFLTCVRDSAWQLRMCTALVGLSPAECAFDDPQRVYAAVARELTWAPIDPNVAPDRGIEHALRTAVEERRAELGEPSLKAWIDTTLRRLPVDSPSYRAAVVAFCRATLSGDDDTADLGAWLRGVTWERRTRLTR